ncbi:MAG TPA: hypothetical protein VNK73_05410 [Actinomycetota bacterium]|jgi:hypothetical protein|nr:hypothetical protein [Actinomycetota bacterium]
MARCRLAESNRILIRRRIRSRASGVAWRLADGSPVATQALAAAGADLVEAVKHAERVILEAGIPLGGVALTEERTQALLPKGYRLLVHQFDVLILKQFVWQAAAWRDA